MRCLSIAFFLVATSVFGASLGPDGVNSLATTLDGDGILLGEADLGRSGKADYDSDILSSENTRPTGVYQQGFSGMAPMDAFVDQHATVVAQQMIGTGLIQGVSPAADLHSIGISDLNDDSEVAQALNQLAELGGGLVKATSISFYGRFQPFIEGPDGNSHFTQFVDWSARKQDVLYTVAWIDSDSPDEIGKPEDNYNGITVAASEQIDDAGPFRRFSGRNAFDADLGDAARIDLLAPGDNLLVLPWNDIPVLAGGSSLATPHVTGAVAQLQQYIDQQIGNGNPRFGFFAYRHEVMKALMLNAADKLEGVHGSTRTVVDFQGFNWRVSEAWGSDEIPLDDQMGAGHLNVLRAVQQLSPGEYDPGIIPSIGWDYDTIGGSGSRTEYIFDSEIGGDYLAVTLTWDRRVELTDPDNTYEAGDLFFTQPLEDSLNNLDVYLLPADSNDLNDAITKSVSFDDSVEHIFYDNFPPGEYKLVVHNNFFNGIGDSQNYALAWWFGDAPPLDLLGDYNNDGNVDEDDYTVWQEDFGSSISAGDGADGNSDGTINAADYVVWRKVVDAAGSGGSQPVPEPSAALMLATLAASICLCCRSSNRGH